MTALLRKMKFPLLLFGLAFLAYGLMIPFLGFYSDDWTFLWITQRFGVSALMFHYLTNRPFLWFLTAPLMSLLGDTAWHYDAIYIFLRTTCALALCWLIKLVWPQNKSLGVITTLIFLLYPGYIVWPEAMLSSRHLILVQNLLFSLAFSILSIKQVEHRRIWMLLALALGMLNQILSDYFLFLEFMRPIFLWIVLTGSNIPVKEKIKNILFYCGPFWIVFSLVMYWRLFCFPNLESWYQISFFSNLQQAPLSFILGRLVQIIKDLWVMLGPGMVGLFGLPDINSEGRPVLLMFIAGAAAAGSIWLFRHHFFPGEEKPDRRVNFSATIIGLLMMIFAGPIFWVVGLPLSITFSGTRFMLPFLVGASLLLAGLLSLLPKRWIIVAVLSIWAGIAVAANVRTANNYRIDWSIQRRLFTQLTLRIPDLAPGTMLASEELPNILPSSTYLSAYTNWVYDQESHGFPNAEYFFVYIAHETEHVTADNILTTHDILNAYPFRGSSSQILGLTYINDCLVVLDPQIDGMDPYLPLNMQELSTLSRPDLILPEYVIIPPELTFTQNEVLVHPWCRSFLAADLAGQFGQWDTVAQIADSDLGTFPMDASMGRFYTVFIEGYANTGRVVEAVELTSQIIAANPETNAMMCSLWNRILLENPDSIDAEQIHALISCP